MQKFRRQYRTEIVCIASLKIREQIRPLLVKRTDYTIGCVYMRLQFVKRGILVLLLMAFAGGIVCASFIGAEFYPGKRSGVITVNGQRYDVSGPVSGVPIMTSVKAQSSLPKVGSMDELVSIMKERGLFYEASASEYTMGGGMRTLAESAAMAPPAADAPTPAPAQAPTPVDGAAVKSLDDSSFSSTNVQTAGVDEGDIIKTDGRYIYSLFENRITIVEANGGSMTKKTSFAPEGEVYLSEMYVLGDRLLLIGTRSEYETAQNEPTPDIAAGSAMKIAPSGIWRPYWGKTFTVFLVYDVSDRSAPRLERRVESEGSPVSSRVSDGNVYFATSKYINAMPLGQEYKDGDILPAYLDTNVSDSKRLIYPGDISICPGSSAANYLQVGSFAISGGELSLDSYLGAGTQLYMSAESLYIAADASDGTGQRTRFFRFEVDGPRLRYVASGDMAGYVLDQYSMDEFGGYFRVAATEWQSGSRVVIFDGDMQLAGSLTGLAKDEQIKSVRFMGATGYVVTFRQIDPLFVIDLSDPKAPKVLGELKIPGFSQYLHPLEDGILVGFGRNIEDYFVKGEDGKDILKGQLDDGMKISMFDVSDPENPREIHKVVYRGSAYSEALNNPRALMCDPQRKLFAFPMDVYDFDSWSGVYAISASKEDGFKTLAKLKSEFSPDYGQRRAVYIGNTLYTASGGGISAYSYSDFTLLGKLQLDTYRNYDDGAKPPVIID